MSNPGRSGGNVWFITAHMMLGGIGFGNQITAETNLFDVAYQQPMATLMKEETSVLMCWLMRSVMVLVALLVITADAAAQKRRKPTLPPPPPAPVVQQPSEEELKELADAASKSRESLIAASNTYRESLERLMALQKQDEDRALAHLETQRRLLELGVIAKRQVEESEVALTAATSKVAETQKQIGGIENLIAEVKAAEEIAKLPPPPPQGELRMTGLLIRYVGASYWALGEFGKVDAFFRLKFKKPLPVSALGQTETHNHLGFDHREAVDVAIHPDSIEGQSLMEFLQTQGISFIAIRGAIPGSATGAHIHIGQPSRRVLAR